MKELLARLGLDVNLSGEELLEWLREREEEVMEQLARRQDAELIRELAGLGYAPAQFLFGTMHLKGDGVRLDDGQALEWLYRSARQGYAPAQFQLGTMYLNGNGVAQNFSQAEKWFRLAAEQGHERAQGYWELAHEKRKLEEQKRPRYAEWSRPGGHAGY